MPAPAVKRARQWFETCFLHLCPPAPPDLHGQCSCRPMRACMHACGARRWGTGCKKVRTAGAAGPDQGASIVVQYHEINVPHGCSRASIRSRACTCNEELPRRVQAGRRTLIFHALPWTGLGSTQLPLSRTDVQQSVDVINNQQTTSHPPIVRPSAALADSLPPLALPYLCTAH